MKYFSKTSLKNKLSFLKSIRIRNFLKLIYFYFVRSKLLETHKNYIYTDEKFKFIHILEAINYQRIAGNDGELIPKTFFEFGCHSGRTFSSAINTANYFGISNYEFYAFDSFKGLPITNSSDDGIFKAGTFYTSEDKFKKIIKDKTYFDMPKTNIIKGFYSDSLTLELQNKLPKAGIIHIDVDLYSSAIEVLRFIKPLLVAGSLILFDDWYCFPAGSEKGERKAFNQFLKENTDIEYETWKAYSTFGKSIFITKIDNN
tara:strand:- start:19343 stop:20116 length:774 start_codon:yes stop_codon:yes gene_type:complete